MIIFLYLFKEDEIFVVIFEYENNIGFIKIYGKIVCYKENIVIIDFNYER